MVMFEFKVRIYSYRKCESDRVMLPVNFIDTVGPIVVASDDSTTE